jgi:hypothetical protein
MPVFRETKSPIRTRRMSAAPPRRGQLSSAIPVSLRVTARRMTVSIGVAVLAVMATVVSAPVSTVSSALRLSADSTALIMGTSTVPTPNDAYVETVKNQFIAPTHPDQQIDYVAVTTPEEGWPLNGLLRLLEFALGPPEIWGPGGPGWPDQPWWKLSGLFDLTLNQSLRAGVGDLEQAMAQHGNDHLVIYGYSQSAVIANLEKRKLAEQYPAGTAAPDIDFVLGGDLNLPNGGLFARFPGLYIPILDWSFNGPAPTDTQFDTVEINRQYDFFADFPLYPLNLIADVNAVLGFFYVHSYPFDVSLAPDASTSTAYRGTHGDTSYYFFPTQDLPLFGPLRTLGVPEPVIDVVEPFFRVLVELGYDRSIPPWEPTPARLIPTLDLGKVATDLVNAVGEGINNALALVGLRPLLSIPAAPATDSAPADTFQQAGSTERATDTGQAASETETECDQVTLTEAGPQTDQTTSTKKPTETDQVTLTEAGPQTDQTTSTKNRTETDQVTLTEAGPQTNQNTSTPASASESSTTLSTSQPSKPADTPEPRGPVERGTVGAVGQQNRDLRHRGNRGQPTNQTAAVDNVNTTRGPSTPSSSSAGSSPSRNSPGGDGDAS